MATAREIAADLRSLGISKGMNLVVHSSLSSLGHVEGGAEAVIDALLEAIGKSGTLVMPTFTFPPEPIFDPETTRSNTGLITETFRKRDCVLRSLHPTHSVVALGPLAQYLIDGHRNSTALGVDSPLHRLALSEGFVLLLGVQHTSNATIHVGEAVAHVPYLDLPYSDTFNVSLTVRDPEAGDKVIPPNENPGCSVNFNVVEKSLSRRGTIRYGNVIQANSQLVRGNDIIDVTGLLLDADPAALLCDVDWCPFCPRARDLLGK